MAVIDWASTSIHIPVVGLGEDFEDYTQLHGLNQRHGLSTSLKNLVGKLLAISLPRASEEPRCRVWSQFDTDLNRGVTVITVMSSTMKDISHAQCL